MPSRNRIRVRTPVLLQMEATECGAAALGSILAYHGVHQTLEQMRAACGVSRDGSNALSLVRVAESFGLAAQGVRAELHNLAERVTFPAIIFWQFNHFLVLEGFDRRKNVYYLNDPSQGRRSVSAQEFDDNFTGVAINFSKTKALLRSGARPSLGRSLAQRLRGQGADLAYLAAITLCLSLVGMVVPLFSKIFIDEVLVRGLDSWMRPLLLAMVVTFVLQTVLLAVQYRVLSLLNLKLALTSSANYISHLFRLPLEFFAQRYLGDLTDRIAACDRVATSLASRVGIHAVNLVNSSIYGLVLLFYNYRLGLVTVFLAALNFLVLGLLNTRRSDANRALVRETGNLLGVSMQGLHAMRTLKANGIENVFFRRWAGIHARQLRKKQQLNLYACVLAVTPVLLSGLTVLVIIWLGSLQIIDGVLSLGGLIAFQALAQQFMQPITHLVGFGGQLQQLQVELERLDDVLSYPTVAVNSGDADTDSDVDDSTTPPRLNGELTLRNLSFRYQPNGAPTLDDINFQVRPGQSIAIVGKSGCGKSTLLKLIAGLYPLQSGEILFDRKPADAWTRSVFGKSVATVSQEIILFDGSLRDNLTLWDKTIGDESVTAALERVGLLQTVSRLPGGYDYPIRAGGRNFSGGQRQCLEIARALVTEPSLLILDEATSALDTRSEKIVMDGIKKYACTTVIVAHRLSAIRDAAQILVLEDGKIVQRGCHAQLICDKTAPYHALIAHQ